jgi:hypothetical protein
MTKRSLLNALASGGRIGFKYADYNKLMGGYLHV